MAPPEGQALGGEGRAGQLAAVINGDVDTVAAELLLLEAGEGLVEQWRCVSQPSTSGQVHSQPAGDSLQPWGQAEGYQDGGGWEGSDGASQIQNKQKGPQGSTKPPCSCDALSHKEGYSKGATRLEDPTVPAKQTSPTVQ